MSESSKRPRMDEIKDRLNAYKSSLESGMQNGIPGVIKMFKRQSLLMAYAPDDIEYLLSTYEQLKAELAEAKSDQERQIKINTQDESEKWKYFSKCEDLTKERDRLKSENDRLRGHLKRIVNERLSVDQLKYIARNALKDQPCL